jgi:hypothetical protein
MLYDLKNDPGEFVNVAARHDDEVRELKKLMLERFRATHPDAGDAPPQAGDDALDYFLRPRDV